MTRFSVHSLFVEVAREIGNCTAPKHPSFDIMTTTGPLFASVGVSELFPTGGHEAAMPLRGFEE